MEVNWYCQKCGKKLPLGLWNLIPASRGDDPDKRSLQCPECRHDYFYCIVENIREGVFENDL